MSIRESEMTPENGPNGFVAADRISTSPLHHNAWSPYAQSPLNKVSRWMGKPATAMDSKTASTALTVPVIVKIRVDHPQSLHICDAEGVIHPTYTPTILLRNAA